METTPLYKALKSYPNINIRYFNLEEYTKNTPLEEFVRNNTLAKSRYPVEHTSDTMRILTIYKYGGLYLDLDVISVFPLRVINRKNFVCLEGNNHFSNAIIRLDRNEGHKYAAEYVE
jgi:lactosylceramide 4-alpha-galactosyltransferase